MKFFITLFLLILGTSADDRISEIVNFRLDSKVTHTIYCHEADKGVTTVVFPSEISGIYASRVDTKFNEKKPSPFLLSFTPGSSYFTIKSLSLKEAAGALNVIHDKKVYVIHLKTAAKGHSSVSFIPLKKSSEASSVTGDKNRSLIPTAALLLSMLDKAKAFHLIKKHHPAHLEGITYHAPASLMNYSTHQILLKEVIRYDESDTIFFHIQIKNKVLTELRYNPRDFAVNVGDKIFYASLTDASGVVPGEGVTSAWFSINGTKAGGRNNLAVKNDWKILLNVLEQPKLTDSKKLQKDTKKQAVLEKGNGLKSEEADVLPTLKDFVLEEKQP